MKRNAVVLILIGSILELINVFGILTTTVDKTQGIDYLIGQYLFNIVLGIAGIVLIVVGVKAEKN